jgi:tetrahydromethanopterin S-methyltransferase subunit G
MSNLVVSKEFAAFKAAVRIPKGIAEQHDEQYEKRLEQIEKKLDELRK